MSAIEWKGQDELFGLNYSTKTGKWEDYKFDIRYDCDGDYEESKIRPSENCGLILTIYKNTKSIHTKFARSVNELMTESIIYMLQEKRKFANAEFI